MSGRGSIICSVLSGTSAALQICVLAPILIYCLRQSRLKRAHLVYSVRYSHITRIQCILMILKLTVGPIFTIIARTTKSDYDSVFQHIIIALNMIITYLFLYSFVWRFWLLRYSIMFNWTLIQNEWKSIITGCQNALSESFYVRYRSTLGNVLFCMVMCMCAAAISCSIYITFTILHPWNHRNNLRGQWNYVIPYFILLPIRFTTPKNVDNFYVRKEMKYIFVCLTMNYIIYYTIHLVLMYRVDIDKDVQDLLRTIKYLLLVFCQFAAMMVSTLWVNRQCDRIIEANQYNVHQIRHEECVQIQPSSYDVIKGVSEGSLDELPLEAVLNEDRLFELFATHAIREFSAECLLSLIEFEQFKARAMDELHVKTSDVSKPMTFAPSIPKSAIVSGVDSSTTKHGLRCFMVDTAEKNTDEMRNLKACAYQLYNKYVASGSDFEINISGQMRAKYNALMADNHEWMNAGVSPESLCGIFDEATAEMTVLLRPSNQRFLLALIRQKRIEHHTMIST